MMTKTNFLVFKKKTVSRSLAGVLVAFFSSCGALGSHPQYDDEGYKLLGELRGEKLSPERVAYYVRKAGFAESVVPKLVCTAQFESSYYTEARNENNNGSIDIGLFQINSMNWNWCTGFDDERAEERLKDPLANAQCAYKVAEGAYAPKLYERWYGYKHNKEKCDSFKLSGE